MSGVLRPGHAAIKVLDLDEAVHFYTNVLGMLETGRDSFGRVYFKAWDERDHNSLVLRQSDRAGLDFFGFKVRDEASLDKLESNLRAWGISTERVAAGEMLATGERVRFESPSGHLLELYAEKKHVGTPMGNRNPDPWPQGLKGIAPIRMDHSFLAGGDVAKTEKLFTEVLDFYVTERILLDDGVTSAAVFLSCSTKSHDIAFGLHPEPGRLHHVSYRLESWEQVLRAADIMSMNKVSIDIAPTRHGVTRGATVYAFDPSGNRFETFSGGYETYPDAEPIEWTFEEMGSAVFFHERNVDPLFFETTT
ncbi:catechol 2,3-dioxygenase [Novosphingobium malaysiense]|nr:catechol 2,3-dioxygenase [Novosphingobium malaysiense]